MTDLETLFVRPSWALAGWLVAAAMSSPAALAAGHAAPAGAGAEAVYQRDMAACERANYVGDRQACRRDAGAARDNRTALQGDADAGAFLRNAMKRCEPLPEADRIDCRARIQGMGSSTGTAAAGGIYRELVTVQPGSPAASAPAPSR